MAKVLYPPALRWSAIVVSFRGSPAADNELMTPGIPIRGGWRPVSSAALDAEHTEYPLYQLVRRMPSAAILSKFGVRVEGWPVKPRSPYPRSSTKSMTKFGGLLPPPEPPAGVAADSMQSVTRVRIDHIVSCSRWKVCNGNCTQFDFFELNLQCFLIIKEVARTSYTCGWRKSAVALLNCAVTCLYSRETDTIIDYRGTLHWSSWGTERSLHVVTVLKTLVSALYRKRVGGVNSASHDHADGQTPRRARCRRASRHLSLINASPLGSSHLVPPAMLHSHPQHHTHVNSKSVRRMVSSGREDSGLSTQTHRERERERERERD